MSYRPFRNIGRSFLAACAVSVVVVTSGLCANAQSTTAPSSSNPSRVDIFTGFSYMGAHGTVQPAGFKYDSVNLGVIGSGAYWFNKYVGAEGVFIGNPDGCPDGNCPVGGDSFYGGYVGPIFRAPMQNFTLFAHGLVGGVRGSGPNQNTGGATDISVEPWQWGPSVMVGGGMDYDLPWFHHMMGIRLFEADYRYIHLDFGPANPALLVTGGRANMSSAELSSGILFHFGHIVPPPPIAYSCVASPASVMPGDTVTVTGTATNVLPKKTAEYSWSGDGSPKSTSNVVTVSMTAPGTYKVMGHVSDDGMKPGRFADCSASFTVTLPPPPTVSCSVTPSSGLTGTSATVTATGSGAAPLTYSYSGTGVAPSSSSSTTLSTSGASAGTISITCNVADKYNQTASASASFMVTTPPPPPPPAVKPHTSALCQIGFDNDKKRPVRVDNEAKACLDAIAISMNDPLAKLAIVGNSAVKPEKTKAAQAAAEKAAWKASEERAINEKEYLVKEKKVDATRISLYTGTTGTNVDTNTLIPSGATLSTTGLTPVVEKPMPVKKAPAKKVPAKPATKPAPAKPAAKKPTTPAKK